MSANSIAVSLPSSPLSISSLADKPSFSSSPEVCYVCEDKVNNSRYGAPACLGCTVFFRRTVIRRKEYRCSKQQRCEIDFAYRCVCQHCRFQKCLNIGMKQAAVKTRDAVGPRHKKREAENPEITILDNFPDTSLLSWVKIQRAQFGEHLKFFAVNQVDVAFHQDKSNVIRYRRRARAHDVDVMLKLCLTQAVDWGNRLEPFRILSLEVKKSILEEYCLAFLIIDQGYKTSKEADNGVWLLQNGSYMHPDYYFGLSPVPMNVKNVAVKAQLHRNFVTELLHCISEPFRLLEIDEIECAALKIILLIKPSFSERNVYEGQESFVTSVFSECMKQLMQHSKKKKPDEAEGRFGEVILLISSIRCAVKTLYNQTRVSDLMNFMEFDQSVRDVLLT